MKQEELRKRLEILTGPEEGAAAAVREELTVEFLPFVEQMAGEYKGRGVNEGDLVGEGSLALFSYLTEFAGDPGEGEAFVAGLGKAVRGAMDAFAAEEEQMKKTGTRLVERANAILDLTEEMAEELGRAATAEELAERLGTDVGQVEAVVRESLNALKAEQNI